jgi:small redox-active disulfide protein 2
MLNVKVLGSGCPNCKRLEAETRAALESAGIAYDLSKVTAYPDIMAYSVIHTPALVINEKVVASGRIPSRSWIIEQARKFETAAESQ